MTTKFIKKPKLPKCCHVSDVVFHTNLLLQVASLALIALSAFTTYWLLRNPKLSNTSVLKGDNYGLWVFCTSTTSPSIPPVPCEYITGFPEWWNASRSFIVMSSVVSLMALVAYFTSAFNFFPGERGRTTFIGATSSFAECVFLVISLCIFHSRSHDTYEAFHVGWSYYTAWGAFICNMGSLFFVFIYFFCRPEPEIKPEPTDEIETEKILGGLSDAPEYKQPNDIATMSPLFNANSNNSHKAGSSKQISPSGSQNSHQYHLIMTNENGSVKTGLKSTSRASSMTSRDPSYTYNLTSAQQPSTSMGNSHSEYQMGILQTTLSV